MRARTASTPLRSRPAAISKPDIDRLCIDTIRTLAIDAVEKAQSGHAGTPMGIAPVAYTLWQQFLRYDPADPLWPNRDRFVLSCGHASRGQQNTHRVKQAALHCSHIRLPLPVFAPQNAPLRTVVPIVARRWRAGILVSVA